MTIKSKLFFSLGWLALLPFLILFLPEKKEKQAPNILFLLTDDQRADALGAYGNPYIHTPNMDRLAREGVMFTHNYCMGSDNGAVCLPSRAMLMSGKSLYHVDKQLQGETVLPRLLHTHGYTTFGTGKWHNGAASFLSSFEKGKNVFLGGMADHFQVPVRDMKPDGTFTEPVKKGFSTDLFADAAITFIQDYAKQQTDQPFFAYVAFTAPHDPRSPSKEYLDLYPEGSLPLPPNFMPYHPFNFGELDIRDEHLAPWPRTPKIIQAQLSDYYGLITHVDDRIGDILQALEDNGLEENTIIVFSSDHGLAMGSHGLLGKQNLYDHSMKAPLIFYGKGIPKGKTRDALVYLYDIFPTLCSLAGIALPQDVDGQDLSGIIRGEIEAVRPSLFTTYKNTQRAVRNQRWKLIRYPQLDYTQLFDLQHDPYELHNLAVDSAYQVKKEEMMVLLKKWQQHSDDDLPLTADTLKPMSYDPTKFKRKPDQHQPAYVLDKYFQE